MYQLFVYVFFVSSFDQVLPFLRNKKRYMVITSKQQEERQVFVRYIRIIIILL